MKAFSCFFPRLSLLAFKHVIPVTLHRHKERAGLPRPVRHGHDGVHFLVRQRFQIKILRGGMFMNRHRPTKRPRLPFVVNPGRFLADPGPAHDVKPHHAVHRVVLGAFLLPSILRARQRDFDTAGLVPVDFQREFRVSFPIRVHVAATALVFRPTARDGACEKWKKASTVNIDRYS